MPTPFCALLTLAVVLASAEVCARIPAVRAALPAPSVGSSSRGFELQLEALRRYVQSTGPIDCLVLGNSTALSGVDPEVLDRVVRARTGRALRCFNFGVAGMAAADTGAAAAILVEEYAPALLLYLVSARDLGTSVTGPRLVDTPWVRHRLGEVSPQGWLAEHSVAYRYYAIYRQWLDPTRWPAATRGSGAAGTGFRPFRRSLPLAAQVWEHVLSVAEPVFAQPPSPVELAGFRRVLQLSSSARVVVVEASAHPRLRQRTKDTPLFAAAERAMREETRRFAVPFWRVDPDLVAADGWADFVHLNTVGAAALSEWLGAHLAAYLANDGGAAEALR